MNSLDKLLEMSRSFALDQAEKTQIPSPFHVEYTATVGQRLAQKLKADATIVAIGTYLMDCMLGQAFQQGKQAEHVKMSESKAVELMSTFSDINEDAKQKILSCVAQHHGVPHFTSLESEICCNADCYKFTSIEGFVGGIHHGRNMPIRDLLKLYQTKVDEKWHALTLPICKQELSPQHNAISQLLARFFETQDYF